MNPALLQTGRYLDKTGTFFDRHILGHGGFVKMTWHRGSNPYPGMVTRSAPNDTAGIIHSVRLSGEGKRERAGG